MKKILIVISFCLLILVACGSVANEGVGANNEESFEMINRSSIGSLNLMYEVKHKETGCHYAVSYVGDSGSLEQMFIEKNGVSVPYCD